MIYEICGGPDENTWKEITGYQFYSEFKPKKMYPRNLLQFLKNKIPK